MNCLCLNVLRVHSLVYLTMLQCCSSFSKAISRMAVLGMPSSSSSSRIFLSAIISPEARSLALYTTPYVP